jgi:hypothetical protein
MFRAHPTRTYRWSHVSPVQQDAPTSILPYPHHRFLRLHRTCVEHRDWSRGALLARTYARCVGITVRRGQVDYGEYGPYYSGVELEEWGVYTYARETYGWCCVSTLTPTSLLAGVWTLQSRCGISARVRRSRSAGTVTGSIRCGCGILGNRQVLRLESR